MEINLLKKRTSLFSVLSCFLFLNLAFVSCSEKGVIENQSKKIGKNVWNEKEPISFQFSIKDTVEYFDVFLTLRNDENYRWSNIYLFSDLTFPNGKTRRDTLEITLADKYGNWTGNNSGTIVTTTARLINHRRFPLSGDYKIDVTHGMRVKELENVLNLGLKIKQWEDNTN